MKKQDVPTLIKLDALANKRYRRHQARSNVRYDPSKRMRHIPQSWNTRKRERYDLTVPPELCLDTQYAATAAFFLKIRQSVRSTTVTIRLRFEDCLRVKPTALLLLLAEVHRARLLRGANVLTGTYPKDPALLRRMCAMGFFHLIGIKSPIEAPRTFPMEYIRFRSGTILVEKSARALRESLLGDAIQMETKARKKLQRGVSEAMLNALQHAYPQKLVPQMSIRNRWWLCGHYHRPTKKLSIMFCDLGVGIPKTLPRRYPWERIRGALSLLPGMSPDDGAMIFAGMSLGRTRTKQENRGKGLNDLRHFIDQAGAGDIQIFSSKGFYQYTGEGKESYESRDTPIAGTLIRWTVPIDRVTNWTGNVDDDSHSN